MQQIVRALVLLISLQATIQGQLIELMQITELLEVVEPDDLVVFNLNNVLFSMRQSAGSTPWAVERIERIQLEQKVDKAQATNLFIPYWHKVLIHSDVEAVEVDTEWVVRKLHRRGIKTIGLTNRYTEMAYPTLYGMQSLGIDLSQSTVWAEDRNVPAAYPAKFIEGVIFNGLLNMKGDTLKAFLMDVGYSPKRVVYVEDKIKHLAYVKERIEEMGIPVVAVRYGAMDEKRAAYSSQLAELQLEYFDRILSDEYARHLLPVAVVSDKEPAPKDRDCTCRELSSFAALDDELEPGSTLILTLDDVVLTSQTSLGAWTTAAYRICSRMRSGFSAEEAERLEERVYEKIQRRAEHQLLDPQLPERIAAWRERGINVYFLAFRPFQLRCCTEDQLSAVGLFDVPVIYTGLLNKEFKCMASVLSSGECTQMNALPLTFVAQRKGHVAALARELPNSLCVRFSLGDERVSARDRAVADLQLDYLGRLPSDEDAERILESGIR